MQTVRYMSMQKLWCMEVLYGLQEPNLDFYVFLHRNQNMALFLSPVMLGKLYRRKL